MIDNGVAINSIKFSSKSELTSRFFGRLKILFFFETSNGRLPLEISSDRPQTRPKRVSDDPRRFIFRRHFFFPAKFSDRNFSFSRPKLLVIERCWLILDVCGDPPKSTYQAGACRIMWNHGPQDIAREPCACFSDYARRSYSLK